MRRFPLGLVRVSDRTQITACVFDSAHLTSELSWVFCFHSASEGFSFPFHFTPVLRTTVVLGWLPHF